ncbi:hypothetical protein D3C73_556800 [compost metagenome]
MTQSLEHFFRTISQGVERFGGGFQGRQLFLLHGHCQPVEQELYVIAFEQRVSRRCGAGKRLVAFGGEFADLCSMGAGADEQEVSWRIGARVDCIACGFERQEQLVAVVGGDGVLHFVDDQHQVGLRLIDDLGEGLRQCRAARVADAVEFESEFETCCADVNVTDGLEYFKGRGARSLQIIECFMNGVVHERGRISQRVTPQVDVDDQGSCCFQRRDQVISQKRRFTGAAQAGHKQT